ncbi:MAG: ferrous iron transport protein A [Epulopiscium sp.]|jgi:ferrous iron transport protein A|nr:ferrous iron transport protein A [Candidatus Epulonipiscium sp.]
MNKECCMASLTIGESGIIKALTAVGAMRRRLQDMGFIEGAKVECILKSPSGDPVAFCIRGAVIALRREDSERIIIAM